MSALLFSEPGAWSGTGGTAVFQNTKRPSSGYQSKKKTAECMLCSKHAFGGGTPLPRRPLLGLVAKMRVHQGNRALPGVQPVSQAAAVMAR